MSEVSEIVETIWYEILYLIDEDTAMDYAREHHVYGLDWGSADPEPEPAPKPRQKMKLPAKPERSAMEELMNLVGLTEAKRVLKQIADYASMIQVRRERGLDEEMPCLNMVFTGNPGTAKTTVARLTARIFKECGVLPTGELIEVGRGDLVGEYVGHTAPKVQAKFAEAKGSVLFIDEAYSLSDDRKNSYGDEAISTIVQEMENHREDTVVIFAGYREEMLEFLARNPGLKSRVPYHVEFPDYTPDELWEIFRLKVKEKGRTITKKGEQAVREILEEAVQHPNFGNGRFARTLAEQGILAQAGRLMKKDPSTLTTRELNALTEADFKPENLFPPEKDAPRRPIGFSLPETVTKTK